ITLISSLLFLHHTELSYFVHKHTSSPHIYFLSLHAALPIYYTLSLHDALPISIVRAHQLEFLVLGQVTEMHGAEFAERDVDADRSEEHTSELQSRGHLVCRLLLEKKIDFVCRHLLEKKKFINACYRIAVVFDIR